MSDLYLETRDLTVEGRTVVGRVVPYNEISYLVPGPSGERIKRGAFARSIETRGRGRIYLNLLHNEAATIGRSTAFDDGFDGLIGTFEVHTSTEGDRALDELRDGYWPYMSVAFRPMGAPTRGPDGVIEIREAYLAHVALVKAPAYEGAEVLAVRDSQAADPVAWAREPKPDIDLSPIPRFW